MPSLPVWLPHKVLVDSGQILQEGPEPDIATGDELPPSHPLYLHVYNKTQQILRDVQ